MIDKLFLAHPRSVNESYWEHMGSALSFAFWLLAAGLAVCVHAVLPSAFEHSASRVVTRLYDRMVVHRIRRAVDDGHAVPEN